MLIYQTVAGSRLYGYNRPDSDYDYRGVFLAPAEQMLGLKPLQEVEEVNNGHEDIVNYELRKFVRLALAGNPNILEILFSNRGIYTSNEWELFREHRYEFLSGRLRKPYSGFLMSEIKKLERKYEPKAAANAWRLARQGYELLTTGDFDPTLDNASAMAMRLIREGDVTPEAALNAIKQWDANLQEARSILPEEPNTSLISAFVVTTYKSYLGL